MPKNAVFYSFLIFRLDLNLPAATICLILCPHNSFTQVQHIIWLIWFFWNSKSPKNSIFWPILAFFGCFEGMTRKKMLEIQVCGRHNLEPHLFPSFHTFIFGHKDLAQLYIAKNAVFHGFLYLEYKIFLKMDIFGGFLVKEL